MRTLRPFFLVTDIGFVVYWLATAFKLIPPEYAFSDYANPTVVAWNWSFLPLDLLISATGLTSVWLFSRRRTGWRELALLSLAFTVASGLNAIAFWAIRGEFDGLWWLSNLYLMIYPVLFIPHLMSFNAERNTPYG